MRGRQKQAPRAESTHTLVRAPHMQGLKKVLSKNVQRYLGPCALIEPSIHILYKYNLKP